MRLKHTCSDCLFVFTWLIQLTCPYIAIGACFLFRLAIASQLWASLWERNQSLIYIYIYFWFIYIYTYIYMNENIEIFCFLVCYFSRLAAVFMQSEELEFSDFETANTLVLSSQVFQRCRTRVCACVHSPWAAALVLADDLLLVIFSCTMRTTLRRPAPASHSRALLPQPSPAHPARTRVRLRWARPQSPRQGKRRAWGLRGRQWTRHHLHTLPSTWEQMLQHHLVLIWL